MANDLVNFPSGESGYERICHNPKRQIIKNNKEINKPDHHHDNGSFTISMKLVTNNAKNGANTIVKTRIVWFLSFLIFFQNVPSFFVVVNM
jgi:hypothetical protein